MALVPYAMDASRSRGRRYPEPPHPYRSDYARDRDRVIHSRAFRRLEAKTQVFTTRYSDHFRNRLTHTLEVAQIARTVAGALGLDTDLAEALALVHDIGHPPFGHAGERKLDDLMRPHGGGGFRRTERRRGAAPDAARGGIQPASGHGRRCAQEVPGRTAVQSTGHRDGPPAVRGSPGPIVRILSRSSGGPAQ